MYEVKIMLFHPSFVLRNNTLFFEGVSYYFVDDPTMFISGNRRGTRSIISSITDKYISTTFHRLIREDRDKAIEYVFGGDIDRLETIRETSSLEDLHALFGSMLVRRYVTGLKQFFGVSLAVPECHVEVFGGETVQYRTSQQFPFVVSEGIGKIYGEGSYGIVYEKIPNDRYLTKFTFSTDAFIIEFLSTFFLIYARNSMLHQYLGMIMVSEENINFHEQRMLKLHRASRTKIIEKYGSTLNVLKVLIRDVAILTDRSYMHMDITPNNVMWDHRLHRLTLIDFGGTLGDDSFYDLGERVLKLCTRTTRPPEYSVRDTLFMRDERSELFSIFYTVCELLFGGDISFPPTTEGECIKRIHSATTLPCEKEDAMMKLAMESGVIAPYINMGDDKQKSRPTFDSFLPLGYHDISTAYMQMFMSRVVDKLFPQKRQEGNSITTAVRRISTHFSLWKHVVFAFTGNLPPQEVRTLFIEELMNTIANDLGALTKSIGDKKVPIYLIFRCIHLFDALYYSNDFYKNLSIKLMVLSLLYISLSLAKFQCVNISHCRQHPVYQVLSQWLRVPDVTSLLFTPLTAYLILVTQEYYSSVWFRCLYSLIPFKRCYHGKIDEDVAARIKMFTRFYFNELRKAPITEPIELFEKFSFLDQQSNITTTKIMEDIISLWF